MIINFSVKNFGSIKEEQQLSFEATKNTHLEEDYVMNIGKHRILKLAMIYGPNASGKTTILKALDFLGKLVNLPAHQKNTELDFSPFLFHPDTPQQNSLITIAFLANGNKYYYELEFCKTAIVREELYSYKPNKALVFKRVTDQTKNLSQISFGSKITKQKSIKSALETHTLSNNTVLGGYQKANTYFEELDEVSDWFTGYLFPMIGPKTDMVSFISDKIIEKKISKKLVLEILQEADFNISKIIIEQKEKHLSQSERELLEIISKDMDKPLPSGPLIDIEVNFGHNIEGQTYILGLKQQSEGTKRYYEFAGLLSVLLTQSCIFLIDELESSLHPDLYEHFLLSFLLNSQNSQIIATTHQREFLNNKDVFRKDSVWMTEKDHSGATQLYSLADFSSSVIKDEHNILNLYKAGRLGALPRLGSTLIQQNEDEEN